MRRSCLAGVALLLACAAPAPPAPPPARPPTPVDAEVSVELWQGFARLPATPLPAAPRVEILLDVTTSMRTFSAAGPRHDRAAREAAAALVERLPDAATVGVDVLGLARRDRCNDPTRVAWGQASRLRALLATRLRGVEPAGEGSVAAALEELARKRAAELHETRVVVLTDLDDSCGGDLCAAAESVVEAGARLELVLFGDAAAPVCLSELHAASEPHAASLPAPAPIAFRVQDHRVTRVTRGAVLARGRTDGRPLEVPGGPALLVVEMDPPARIGPMLLAPGTRTRVRMLDFPTLRPHVREWRWNVEPLRSDSLAEGP